MGEQMLQREARAWEASTLCLRRSTFVGALLVAGSLIGSLSAVAQESGAQLFEGSCSACHSIGEGREVGPDLKGVSERRSEDWLLKAIRSFQSLAKSGDKDAAALIAEYKMRMPDQSLSEAQIRKILAHIKEAGSAPAAAAPQAPALAAAAQTPGAPPAAVAAADPETIQLGADLFSGKVRFANGGPSCNACHYVASDSQLGGGLLAAELTLVFSRLGKQGVNAILSGNPFPVMQTAFAGKEFSPKEIDALVSFLQHVDQEHARQMPKEWGWRMFSAGTGGVIVLAGIFLLVGRRRKKKGVNQDIFDRQIKSE